MTKNLCKWFMADGASCVAADDSFQTKDKLKPGCRKPNWLTTIMNEGLINIKEMPLMLEKNLIINENTTR